MRRQLPVPIAVLFLMYREKLIPCCPGDTPRLLDKDELAMENQQGAEGPDVEQSEHGAGGKEVEQSILHYIFQNGQKTICERRVQVTVISSAAVGTTTCAACRSPSS